MRRWRTIGAIALAISLFLATACRSPKAVECQRVFNEIEQNTERMRVGVVDRSGHIENADLTEKLANKLQALKITDATLKNRVDLLAEGYRAQVKAQYEEIQLMNEAGTVRYSSGDATEATLHAIQARAKQAGERSQLAIDTLALYCPS